MPNVGAPGPDTIKRWAAILRLNANSWKQVSPPVFQRLKGYYIYGEFLLGGVGEHLPKQPWNDNGVYAHKEVARHLSVFCPRWRVVGFAHDVVIQQDPEHLKVS